MKFFKTVNIILEEKWLLITEKKSKVKFNIIMIIIIFKENLKKFYLK